jgi:uncharacterized protein YbjQ (UPF0145 family)
MKAKEIARAYGIDYNELSNFIGTQVDSNIYKRSFTGEYDIADINVEPLLAHFNQYKANEAVLRAQQQEEAGKKQAVLANMLITSGFSFDGYTITKYSGYISGDDAVQIERGTSGIFSSATDVGASLMASLSRIRRNALAELKEAAYALGCNAVIGVDFDYLTLDPETSNGAWSAQNTRTVYLPYVFGVTANGNAVIIEKNSTT